MVRPAVDGQALDLVEDRGVRRVELVGPVHPARARRRRSAASRRSIVRACTGLVCVRSTRPESSGRDEEGVHHRAGRVVAADVERVEVQPLRPRARGRRRPRSPCPRRCRRSGRSAWSAGAGRRAGVRSQGSVTSTRSSASTRASRSASSSASRVVVGLGDGDPGGVDPLAGVARAAGGSAPSSRRASSTGAAVAAGAPGGRRPAPPGRARPANAFCAALTASSSASGDSAATCLGS